MVTPSAASLSTNRSWPGKCATASPRPEPRRCSLPAQSGEGRDPYPLAIVDQQMPDMDGMTLARRNQGRPDNLRHPAHLAQLISESGSVRQELHASGFTDCCFKPVRQSSLFDCLANAMGETPAASPLSPAEQLTLPEPGRQQQKVRVLIAEDNAVNRLVALGQLKQPWL